MSDGTLGTPETEVQQKQTPEVWDIIAGKGLEVVNRKGWQFYRQELEYLTWEPIANTQIHQINALREQAKTEPPFVVNQSEAIQIRNRVLQYTEDSIALHPREGQEAYYAHKDGNKLYFTGKNFPKFGVGNTTRIYMALRQGAMPFAMESLREQLAANSAIDRMFLVLNLEAIQGQDSTGVDNNAVVMYIPDSDPQTLARVSSAITEAKKQKPKVFELTSQQLADAKTASTVEFMIPLDDTTWFVEVEPQQKGGTESYHQGVFAEMRTSVYRGFSPVNDEGLPNIDIYKETLDTRRAEIRNIAPIIDHNSQKPLPRRLSMPALVSTK